MTLTTFTAELKKLIKAYWAIFSSACAFALITFSSAALTLSMYIFVEFVKISSFWNNKKEIIQRTNIILIHRNNIQKLSKYKSVSHKYVDLEWCI